MKRLFPLALACGALLLVGGCAQNESPPGAGVVKQFAAAYLSARAFDRASVALGQGNTGQLQRAGEDLRLADANAPQQLRYSSAFISLLVEDANVAQANATSETGVTRTSLQADANSRYRAALAFVPSDSKTLAQDKQISPNDLNSLGYFLAEQGETTADWQQAELLTRLALEKWDVWYLGSEATDDAKALNAYKKAVMPQDSHAWALFKLGRLTEAKTEAERVIATVANSPITVPPSADILFHLAEIYRVSGEATKSMPLYQQALRLNPDNETRRQMENRLKVLSGQWREVQKPLDQSESFG